MQPVDEKEKARAAFRAEMEAKFGDEIYIYEGAPKLGAFVFQSPSRAVTKQFKSGSRKKGADADACAEQLVINCLCYPEGEAGKPDYGKLQNLFEAKSFASDTIFAALAKLAGLDLDDAGKG
jgi:hypothetical protein